MFSSTFTLASLLAATALVNAASPFAIPALIARQTTGNTCLDGAIDVCTSSTVTEASCRAAICGNTCLSQFPILKGCCDSAQSLSALGSCVSDLDPASVESALSTAGVNTDLTAPTSSARTSSGAATTTPSSSAPTTSAPTAAGAGGIATTGASTTPKPSTAATVVVLTNSAGQPTATTTNTGGVDRVVAGQLGVAGSVFAYVLSLLLL